MAIFHCSVKTGSRSGGKSAVASAAYRAGEKLQDNETGIISDYTHKGGVVFSEISLCNNAPSEYMNREVLWNAVHSIEKQKNARLYREFEVALPVELSRENQIDTVREFVSGLTNRGMCADWALHDKGDGNPHAHIMTTTRSIKEDGSWAPKSRKIYDLDENGEKIFQKIDKSGRKQYKSHKEDYNDWNETERIEEWRTEWEQCCNKRLDKENQIDHRSFERQGIECIPTIHEGYTARKIVADGGVSERVEYNKAVKQENIFLNLVHRLFNAGEQLFKRLIRARDEEIEKERKLKEQKIKEAEVKGNIEDNERKRQIAELFARRRRQINSLDNEFIYGERQSTSGDTGTATTDTDDIIRKAKAIEASARAIFADTAASGNIVKTEEQQPTGTEKNNSTNKIRSRRVR